MRSAILGNDLKRFDTYTKLALKHKESMVVQYYEGELLELLVSLGFFCIPRKTLPNISGCPNSKRVLIYIRVSSEALGKCVRT